MTFTPTFDQPTMTDWPAGTTGIYDPAVDGPMTSYNPPPTGTQFPVNPTLTPPLPAPVPSSPAPAPDPGTDQQRDAMANLRATLGQYGLGTLGDWAWQQIVGGRSQAEILQGLRERPEYAARFPGMAARQKAGLPAISEADYVNYETTARQIMRASGLPPGFYDQPDDYTNLLAHDVSAKELQDRVVKGYQQVATAPPEVRAAFNHFYGVNGNGNLAAYFLDPTKAEPVLEQQLQAAQVGGLGGDFGVNLNRTMAERIGTQGLADSSLRAGFQKLSDLAPLFGDTISENRGLTADEQGAEAVFGLNGQAQTDVQKALTARAAQFQGGGQAQAGTTGISGLGTARSL